jgi:hypothetical protein
VQLQFVDGSVGAALFQDGSGISVSHQGQSVGNVSQADVNASANSDGDDAGESIVENVTDLLPVELTEASRRTLVEAANSWTATHPS